MSAAALNFFSSDHIQIYLSHHVVLHVKYSSKIEIILFINAWYNYCIERFPEPEEEAIKLFRSIVNVIQRDWWAPSIVAPRAKGSPMLNKIP